MDYDRYDAFLHHIFKQTQGDAWFRPSEDNLSAGVCLRVDHGECFLLAFFGIIFCFLVEYFGFSTSLPFGGIVGGPSSLKADRSAHGRGKKTSEEEK